ncbi:phosphotransferase family protein [Amycolatopsis thermoflava]|uniref:Aminoglycoside phosphotransferase (APT) family kinase protein n=1 Tax=Amycolatopsis thermoflava TaxID=84480 RepID=A0A3N2G7A9_9PSEU|nr:phosphotransferase family protein [Amycolatopsis thermoflava]ROS32089.1 aminoglycoside phosphotransferase (APT) family kinase protein [Amycolatopsis thermoflava]
MSWDWNDEQRDGLARFLAAREICAGPVTTRRIGDGHSNLTFLVSDGQRRVVVRRPPPPPIPPGAHDMLREAKLIGALAGTDVPVADVLAVGQAGEVIDVPFYVMSYVEGPVITERTPEALSTPADRRRIGESLVDTLAALHAVDWRARGLADLGRPEGFNARHFRRMGRLIADADGKPPAEFAGIDAWLAAHVPPEAGATIVHNDYRLGNVIVAPEPPGRILAVLDWELATLGDPLFDVGYFLASWPVAGQPRTPTEDLGVAVLEDGYPTREQLAERYAAATGRDLSTLDWYTALALWKLAVLYEYGRRRAVQGVGDEYYADAGMVKSFLTAAEQVAS